MGAQYELASSLCVTIGGCDKDSALYYGPLSHMSVCGNPIQAGFTVAIL